MAKQKVRYKVTYTNFGRAAVVWRDSLKEARREVKDLKAQGYLVVKLYKCTEENITLLK